MKCSCIDIGSNTIKISVFEKKGKRWESVAFLGEQTGLISYVCLIEGKRYLSDLGIKELMSALGRLVVFSEQNCADRIFAFATASLRGVENIDSIKSKVFEAFGLFLDVLSGEEEAICSLKGLLCDERCENVSEGVMIDMGGGSTELVHFMNGRSPEIISLPIGCLSLTNECVYSQPPTADDIIRLKERVGAELSTCGKYKKLNCPVFLIGGTARAAAKLCSYLKPRKKDVYSSKDFELIYSKMIKDAEMSEIAVRLIPKRVHTITSGAVAYSELLKFISPTAVYVSDSGVREGYLERILL